MIKVIDVDKLFDKYIESYVYSNIGKVKPEEIEDKIPQLYLEFGNQKLEELDGKTPNSYYRDFSGKELVECLKKHIEKGVSVSDFLCEAIIQNSKNEDALIDALNGDESEEFTLYLMNMLSDMNCKKTAKRYLEFIIWDFSVAVRELAPELLSSMAEDVKEEVLKELNEVEGEKRDCLVEILSHCKNDDRVFDLLIAEFAKHQNQIPLYANYLVKYGDERALPFLLASIEKEKISYADFEELRFAIESLGGEYNKPRDFSADKTYKKIKGQTEQTDK